jgi:hypothetical protein
VIKCSKQRIDGIYTANDQTWSFITQIDPQGFECLDKQMETKSIPLLLFVTPPAFLSVLPGHAHRCPAAAFAGYAGNPIPRQTQARLQKEKRKNMSVEQTIVERERPQDALQEPPLEQSHDKEGLAE